jgi:excisionase family DNA binding protein
MEKLYTIQEIADLLQVHQLTVRRWIKEEKLKCLRLSERNIRISKTELDRFVNDKGAESDG